MEKVYGRKDFKKDRSGGIYIKDAIRHGLLEIPDASSHWT